MKTLISHSLEETGKIAADWLADLTSKYDALDEALVVGLSGHLGAGKTAFVKEAAKALGINEEVTSPTFVIMKIYGTKHPRFRRLVHIDAYRLEKREELEVLQWEKLVSDPHNLIMIEWPENVALSLETKIAAISFEIRDDSRYINFIDR